MFPYEYIYMKFKWSTVLIGLRYTRAKMSTYVEV